MMRSPTLDTVNYEGISFVAINIEIADKFGKLIAKADYRAAHSLLTKEAQQVYSSQDFKKSVEQMTDYWSGPIEEVISDLILEDWPAKQDKDIGIVYVSLIGDGVCEAVTVTLTEENSDTRIRYLEWGRP
jgi:hypothetical protein